MSRLACLTVMLFALVPAPASAQLKANFLTPKEIADGWLLLFDGETTFGWQIEGDAKVADGLLMIGGGRASSITATTGFLDYDLTLESVHGGVFHVGWKANGNKILHNLAFSGESASFRANVRGSKGTHGMKLDATAADGSRKTATGAAGLNNFDFSGGSHFMIATEPGAKLAIRNVKLRPVGLKSTFYGKNLSGWREFPNKKSKFSGNGEGEVTVKNGPGDLQTEGQWGDFVLQLECLSHGKHLNSGVFFRCRPGEYQQGYEAQIRNQFTANPTQSYTIDAYDSQTHKKIGSHKVMSTAVDYGTGGIYRRQPARKEASKDNEWFTMTIVAQGNHFATWVNGYQETDWTDNRPPNDNARNGFRLAPGPLSLQGHDATTDLSFRNFRIAELPAKKH